MLNINTKKYWNTMYAVENTEPWRLNKVGFGKIASCIDAGKKVLDIGCGQGILLDTLKAAGNETYGLDISDVAIDFIRQKGHQGIAKSVYDLKPEDFDTKFDFIVLSHILEHLDFDKQAMEICKGLLKEGGQIIGIVPDNCLSMEEEIEHVRVYDKVSLINLLGNCLIEGFQESFFSTRGGIVNKEEFECLLFIKQCGQLNAQEDKR